MSDYSERYGLIMLGPGDQYSDDDYAFSQKNIRSIDSKLYLGAEAHVHDGSGVDLADPVSGPSVTLVPGGGTIPAGRTIKYRYSYVDPFGAETAVSPISTVSTPISVVTPGSPTLTAAATGGTLLPGNYFYAMSAYVNNINMETLVSNRAYKTLFSGSTNKITLTLPALPAGADGFNIYRRSPGSTRFQYLTSVDMTVATPPSTFVDTGSIAEDCNRTTPNANNTGSTNGVSVALPGATPTVPIGYTWKLYRSYNDSWESSLLSWVVEETSEGSGIIIPTYTDVGIGTGGGTPSSATELVSSPSKVLLTNMAEVQGILPTSGYIVPITVNFSFPDTLTAGTGAWSWRNIYEKAEIKEISLHLGVNSAPASQQVIVNVLKYSTNAATPSWDTVFPNSGARPVIGVGSMIGARVTSFLSPVHVLAKNDLLRSDIIQAGGGATPTDFNLVVSILLNVWINDPVTHVWSA